MVFVFVGCQGDVKGAAAPPGAYSAVAVSARLDGTWPGPPWIEDPAFCSIYPCWRLTPMNSRFHGACPALFMPSFRPYFGRRNKNGGPSKLPPAQFRPRSRPIAGCPTAQATWGDVCSLARRIFFFFFSGVGDACMNLPFFVFGSGLCGPSFISSADDQVMPWSAFPMQTLFLGNAPKMWDLRVPPAQHLGRRKAPSVAGVVFFFR